MYPNQPQMPQAPAQYPAQPQYPAPAMPQYPPQQYAAPAPQQYQAPAPQPQYQAPQQPAATGTLDGFFNQPSAGGGKALVFDVVDQEYVGVVARKITDGDIQQQTNRQGVPQFFKDGRPKYVMLVPLQMQPSPAYPDGVATWYVKGQHRDELVRAMSEAGAPEGPPEMGAVVRIRYVGDRAIPNMSAQKLAAVVYQRPNNGQPATPPVSAPPVQAAPPAAPPQQYPAPAAQMPAPAPVAAPAPAAASTGPQLSPEQQALLAKLTGGQAAA